MGVPAEHLTTIDHVMELPTPHHRPDREWDGQKFVHSRLEGAIWGPWRMPGFEARDTGVEDGTKGVAAVRVVRPATGEEQAAPVTSHDSDILFTCKFGEKLGFWLYKGVYVELTYLQPTQSSSPARAHCMARVKIPGS